MIEDYEKELNNPDPLKSSKAILGWFIAMVLFWGAVILLAIYS